MSQATVRLTRKTLISFLGFLILLALPGSEFASGADQDAETAAIKKFNRYIKDKNDDSRAAVVKSLAAIDSEAAVKALGKSLTDKSWKVQAALLRVFSGYTSDGAVRALEELSSRGSSVSRAIVLVSLGKIGRPSSLPALIQAAEDRAWEVRRAAAESLGRYKDDERIASSLLKLLEDSEPVIRTIAADSLGDLGDEEAVPGLIAGLADEKWQVQAAVIKSLGKLRDPRCVQLLIDLMRRPGRLQEDSRSALEAISEFDFGLNPDTWQGWWDRNKDGYVVPEKKQGRKSKSAPGPGASQKSRSAPAPTQQRTRYGTTTKYYGIKTPSDRILFILDVSKSMADKVTVLKPELLAGRDVDSEVKMEIAKAELIHTLKGLDSGVRFNVLVFHTVVDRWKKKLQPCTSSNRKSAIDFIAKQKPRGSERLKARPGKRSSANAEIGRTNTFGVLVEAMAITGMGAIDRHYRTAVDTIFLLSDGEPTAGKITQPPQILREISGKNKLKRVSIHTINFGKSPAGASLLRDLARQNDGKYVDLVGETTMGRRR